MRHGRTNFAIPENSMQNGVSGGLAASGSKKLGLLISSILEGISGAACTFGAINFRSGNSSLEPPSTGKTGVGDN
jgi:hypothetical protein